MSTRRSTFQPPKPIPAVTGRDGYTQPRVIRLEVSVADSDDVVNLGTSNRVVLVREDGRRETVTLIIEQVDQ